MRNVERSCLYTFHGFNMYMLKERECKIFYVFIYITGSEYFNFLNQITMTDKTFD